MVRQFTLPRNPLAHFCRSQPSDCKIARQATALNWRLYLLAVPGRGFGLRGLTDSPGGDLIQATILISFFNFLGLETRRSSKRTKGDKKDMWVLTMARLTSRAKLARAPGGDSFLPFLQVGEAQVTAPFRVLHQTHRFGLGFAWAGLNSPKSQQGPNWWVPLGLPFHTTPRAPTPRETYATVPASPPHGVRGLLLPTLFVNIAAASGRTF